MVEHLPNLCKALGNGPDLLNNCPCFYLYSSVISWSLVIPRCAPCAVESNLGSNQGIFPPSLGKPECFAVQKSLSGAMVKQTWGWGIMVEAPHGVHWYLDWICSHRVVWVDPWSEWIQKRRGRATGERPGTSVSGVVAIIVPWVENDVGSRKGSAQLPVGIQ